MPIPVLSWCTAINLPECHIKAAHRAESAVISYLQHAVCSSNQLPLGMCDTLQHHMFEQSMAKRPFEHTIGIISIQPYRTTDIRYTQRPVIISRNVHGHIGNLSDITLAHPFSDTTLHIIFRQA